MVAGNAGKASRAGRPPGAYELFARLPVAPAGGDIPADADLNKAIVCGSRPVVLLADALPPTYPRAATASHRAATFSIRATASSRFSRELA